MSNEKSIQPRCPSCFTDKIDHLKIETIEARIQSVVLHVDGKITDETKTKTIISILASCPNCGFILANSVSGAMTFLKEHRTESFVSKEMQKKIIYYTEEP
jgi:hypothetical protein